MMNKELFLMVDRLELLFSLLNHIFPSTSMTHKTRLSRNLTLIKLLLFFLVFRIHGFFNLKTYSVWLETWYATLLMTTTYTCDLPISTNCLKKPTWIASTKSPCTNSCLLSPASYRSTCFANSTVYSYNVPVSYLGSGTTQAITFRPFTISGPNFALICISHLIP